MDVDTVSISCGIRQLFRLGIAHECYLGDMSEAEATCYWVSKVYNTASPIIIFSDNYFIQRGHHLATFIKENELGQIVFIENWRNDYSGNLIGIWIWRYELPKMYNYFLGKKIPETLVDYTNKCLAEIDKRAYR